MEKGLLKELAEKIFILKSGFQSLFHRCGKVCGKLEG